MSNINQLDKEVINMDIEDVIVYYIELKQYISDLSKLNSDIKKMIQPPDWIVQPGSGTNYIHQIGLSDPQG